MIVDNDSFLQKAKNFFILNWWLLWIVIGVSSFMSVKLNMDTNAKVEKTMEAVEKNSKGVIMLTYSGVPIYGDKTIIDIQNEHFKKSLKAMLQKYLIVDAARITNDYRNTPTTIEEMFNKSEDIMDFNEHFLQAKTDKNAFNQMKDHLNVLLSLLKEGNLPETIVLLSSKIDKYEIKNNTFNITVYADVKVEYYLPEIRDWERKRTGLKIEATGKFDSALGNPFNPLGIKIDAFQVTYPKKRGN